MDDLFAALLIAFLVAMGGLAFGFSMSKSAVIRDCEIAGQFRNNNTVYLCEKKK